MLIGQSLFEAGEVLPGAVWLGAAAVLLVVVVCAFVWVLAQRNRDWMLAHFRTLDGWLTARAPRPWGVLKQRFDPHDWYGLALTVIAVVTVGSMFLFAGITESWMEQEELYRIDRAVQRLTEGALSEPVLRGLRLVTHFGDFGVALAATLVVAAYLYYRRRRWYLTGLILTMVGGEALVWSMKFIFARERPGAQLADAVGHSFPSGHSFTAAALYGFLIFLTWRLHVSRWVRAAVTAGLVVLILLVGVSRIFLSVHWVSDVMGGFIIALAWLVFSLGVAKTLDARRARWRQT